jgi:putative hydrolase of the HAD superfamily
MQIKAVVFDADGVVILPNRFAEYLEREHHLTREHTSDFFRGIFEECLVGRADLKQELAPYLVKWGWLASTDEFMHRWFTEEHVVDQRVTSVVADLRQRGIRCCLATNQEKYRIEYMQTTMGFSSLLDMIFFSGGLGYKKPDAAFYQHVEQALQLARSEILFWDDAPINVEAARRRGWNAEEYTNFEAFERKMLAYLA